MKKSLAQRVVDKLMGKNVCPACGGDGVTAYPNKVSRQCDNAHCDVRRYHNGVVLESGWLTKEYREGPGNA
jgi:hypothetical protein